MGFRAIRSGVLTIGLVLVLAGCVVAPGTETSLPASEPTHSVEPSVTWEPSPSSSALPPATPTKTAVATEEETAMGFCYLFILESGERAGGMPVEQEVTYVGVDSIVQAGREMSDEVILQFGEEELDTSLLFASLRQAGFPAPPKEPTPAPGTPVLVSEGWGPTLTIEAGRCDGTASRWSGDPENVPELLVSVVADVRALRSAVEWDDLRPGTIYVRAEYLAPDTANQLREADKLTDLTDQQLEANPPLSTALHNVRRLVQIPTEFQQYVDIPGALTQGTRLYVTYEQTAYQIRHLVTESE